MEHWTCLLGSIVRTYEPSVAPGHQRMMRPSALQILQRRGRREACDMSRPRSSVVRLDLTSHQVVSHSVFFQLDRSDVPESLYAHALGASNHHFVRGNTYTVSDSKIDVLQVLTLPDDSDPGGESDDDSVVAHISYIAQRDEPLPLRALSQSNEGILNAVARQYEGPPIKFRSVTNFDIVDSRQVYQLVGLMDSAEAEQRELRPMVRGLRGTFQRPLPKSARVAYQIDRQAADLYRAIITMQYEDAPHPKVLRSTFSLAVKYKHALLVQSPGERSAENQDAARHD